MKNIIKLSKIIALILFSHNSFSQDVTVEIQSLQYTVNGQSTSAPNCGNIDFGSGSTISINFGINLKKPSTLVVGNGEVKVFTKKSSSDAEVQRQLITIQSGSWTNGNPATRSTTGNITLNSSDFNTTGGTLYITYTSASGIIYKSCDYSIGKPQPPVFTISPSIVSIPCGSTTNYKFTVNNVYNSAGTLRYLWETRTGWNQTDRFYSSQNFWTFSPTLSPLPSSIKVTPELNGVLQTQLTSTVSLAPFTNTIAITGNSAICPSTSAVYSVSDLGSGSAISWSTSDTSIATVIPISGNQATVNPIATQGTFDLTAVVTNACGQQKTLTKVLTIGRPMFQINYVSRDLFIDLTLSPDYDSASLEEQGVDINAISWNKIAEEGGNVYFSGDGLYGTVLFPNNNSSITINVSLTNSCGTTSYPVVLMSGYADSRIGYSQPSISKISNDLYEIINVPEDTNKVKVSVYDIYGSMVLKTNTTNQINLSNLKAGIYVIKAQVKDTMITLKIIKN